MVTKFQAIKFDAINKNDEIGLVEGELEAILDNIYQENNTVTKLYPEAKERTKERV